MTQSVLRENGAASFVRALLVFVGAWLVRKGAITEDQSQAMISQGTDFLLGLCLALSETAWGLWQKVHANQKIDTALSLPAGTPRETLEKKVDKA